MRWDFQNGKDGWVWQHIKPDGTLDAPAPAPSFGAAMRDAMKAGFSPAKDVWLVDDLNSVTLFEPGKEPQIMSVNRRHS